jgi:CRISPR-associated protein Cas5d
MRRNEIGAKISVALATQAMNAESADGLGLSIEKNRQQRATTLLVDVGYVIEAHFALTGRVEDRDTEAKHISMFNRRSAGGQCFHQPYFGTREFPANFALIHKNEVIPKTLLLEDQRDIDLGWMLYDIEYPGAHARFFHARMEDGVIDVRRCLADSDLS